MFTARRLVPSVTRIARRHNSSWTPPSDPTALLMHVPDATWSVSSLLPDSTSSPSVDAASDSITKKKLHHLLRLSALPPPESEAEEEALLKSLHNHLHFVKAIQAVDTKDVPPMRRVEDEWEFKKYEFEELNEKNRRDKTEWKPMELPKKKFGEFYMVDGKVAEEMEG
jgi:Asp-tRNA(Asn)/Glu-tRNA(Gln) amidotransferase C subunit